MEEPKVLDGCDLKEATAHGKALQEWLELQPMERRPWWVRGLEEVLPVGTHARAVPEELQPILDLFMKDSIPWEESHAGTGKGNKLEGVAITVY